MTSRGSIRNAKKHSTITEPTVNDRLGKVIHISQAARFKEARNWNALSSKLTEGSGDNLANQSAIKKEPGFALDTISSYYYRSLITSRHKSTIKEKEDSVIDAPFVDRPTHRRNNTIDKWLSEHNKKREKARKANAPAPSSTAETNNLLMNRSFGREASFSASFRNMMYRDHGLSAASRQK